VKMVSASMDNNSIKAPKVSVVIAAYNQERFIGRCLRSLLRQTLPHSDYEIIVVNDGSIDRTSYALSLFIDPNDSTIRIFETSVNHGLPAALNLGITNSKAEYIVRVDSDDFVNSNFLNFLYYYLETNPDADAVGCDYYLLDDYENVIQRVSSLECPIACGIMFRKDRLYDIGLYDETFRLHEERELRIRFERKFKIDHLKLPLYRYRRHQSNMTNDQVEMEKYSQILALKHGKDCE